MKMKERERETSERQSQRETDRRFIKTTTTTITKHIYEGNT